MFTALPFRILDVTVCSLNVSIKIYKAVILPIVLYGCETSVSRNKRRRQIDGVWEQSKVKLSRYTPWRRFRGEEVQLLPVIDLGTRWGWVVSVTPRPRFTLGTYWIGGWVGSRAGLDAKARRKILCPCRGSNPSRPVRSQTIYWSTPVPIFGLKRDEVTGGWRKLRNGELRDLYSYQMLLMLLMWWNQGRWDWRGSQHDNILVGKSEGMLLRGIPERKWEVNIKMDRKIIVCKGVDWINLAHVGVQGWTLMNTIMNLRVP
jgi:hypothetical protein